LSPVPARRPGRRSRDRHRGLPGDWRRLVYHIRYGSRSRKHAFRRTDLDRNPLAAFRAY